jgi:iron complex transport system substrate-binding protein
LAARPDLVLAVPNPGNREAVLAIERAGQRVVVVEDRSLADLWASIERIAAALGDPAAGPVLVARVQAELASVRASVAGKPRARVLLVVGHRPLIVAGGGTLQDELLEIAGGRNVAADAATSWPQFSMEVVIARRPDVILDAAMGTEAGADALFASLAGAGDGPRIVPMATDTLLRAGPRVGQAARTLARALHPDLNPSDSGP